MKNSFNFNPGLYRMLVLAVCTMLLLIFSAARADKRCKITEVKVWQAAEDEIAIQVRSDDGRPVKFTLHSESGKIVRAMQIIHSKVTMIGGLTKGMYTYHCISHDNDEYKGKVVLK